MMTGHDVVDALLRGRKPDRMGLHEYMWGDTLRMWVTEGYPAKENGDPVDPVDHFGFDLCGAGGWFDLAPLRGVKEVVEETDEWVIRRNGAGASLKWWKNKSGTPEHIAFRMTSRDIWERDYRPHLLQPDPERVDFESAARELKRRREQHKWAHYGHMFIWENLRQSLGDICMYESLVADPDWIHDINRVYTDLFKTHYAMLFERVGLPDGVWIYEDLGFKNGLFCSPCHIHGQIGRAHV